MKKKLAIFDMDGTILNTLDDLADCMNYSLRCFNLPQRSLKEIRSFVGNGVHTLVQKSAPEGSPREKLDELYGVYRKYYAQHSNIKTRAYDGIIEAVNELKASGVKVAVASNKLQDVVINLCDQYFAGVFDYAIGDAPERRLKPHPDCIFDVLKHFDIDIEDAVYIGDIEVDFQTAQSSGIDLLLVEWGYRDKEYLETLGETTIISKPEDLVKQIG